MECYTRTEGVVQVDALPVTMPPDLDDAVTVRRLYKKEELLFELQRMKQGKDPISLDLTGLKDLSSNQIMALCDQLRGLPIVKLNLSGTMVTNLDFLEDNETLKVLKLYGCKSLESIEGLKGSPLEEFAISDCAAWMNKLSVSGSNFCPLKDASTLKVLTLHMIREANFNPLHRPSLMELNFWGMQVNLGLLRGVSSLETLSLRRCSKFKSSASVLGNLSVKKLDLSQTDITHVKFLGNNTAIQILNLEGCELKDWSGLHKLKLRELNVCNTKADWSTLIDMTTLQKLSVSSTATVPEELSNREGLTIEYC